MAFLERTMVQEKMSGRSAVVVADVDGTILATDLLYESLLLALKRNPLVLFLLPWWLLRGRSTLKSELARRAEGLRVDLMPVHEGVVSYLEMQAASGRRVVLASASDERLVARVADRFNFVTHSIGSSVSRNCKGSKKVEAIKEYLGQHDWEYVGDSEADIAVWREACEVTAVVSSTGYAETISRTFPGARMIEVVRPSWSVILRVLRVHQWLKNFLIFAPMFLAHRWLEPMVVGRSVLAAVAFSLCASGVYILNDLLDLASDRQHPRKKKRPCAAGTFPLVYAICLAPLLFVLAFSVAWQIHSQFVGLLLVYLLITTAYSFRLKAIVLVDIILLAMLYTIRIVGGGVATEIPLSQWLLGVSMFLFLSLACVKRFSELLILQQRNEKRTWGRGYWVGDLEQVSSFGSASGYIAALVLVLYVSSNEVVALYQSPKMIWLACPLMLYWISRVWLLARRGLVHDDPLVFALRDIGTYAVGLLLLLIFTAARLGL
jgi:4-hydroxybenzoate polyprenyltransferase/phosphoserine phosphatase